MNYIYDFLILAFLAADGFLIARFIKHGGINFLSILLFAFFLLAWITVFYGSFIEPRVLVVKNYRIDLSSSPSETLRVALFSDIHAGPYKKEDFVEKIVSKTNSLNTDLILIAGDFVFDDEGEVKYLTPLKALRAPLGVFAVLGNHDYGNGRGQNWGEKEWRRAAAVRAKLEELGIKVLVNAGVKIQKNNKNLFLLGIDDIWTRRADIKTAIKSLSDDKTPHPNILFSHNPDSVLLTDNLEIDLILSGHTHAGQIRLPFWGSVPPLPDYLGRKYDRGLFQFNQKQLFITPGVGEIGARARLFNPPEIDVLEIGF